MDKYVKIEDAAKAFSFHTPYCYDDCLNDLRSSILNGFIYSYDVAPVVHAKWIDEDFPQNQATVHGFAVCSACGELSHKAEHGYNILSKYCPHCGAKMDLADD